MFLIGWWVRVVGLIGAEWGWLFVETQCRVYTSNHLQMGDCGETCHGGSRLRAGGRAEGG